MKIFIFLYVFYILIAWHETLWSTLFKNPVVWTYHSADAASTDGGLELAVQFFDCTGCIKALSQQNDPIQEEKRSNAIDDILHQLYSVKEQRHT